MICGHLANAIIQTLGYIFCFAISLKMASKESTKHSPQGLGLNGLSFFLTVISFSNFYYYSTTRACRMVYDLFILHAVLLIVTSVYKFLLKKRGAENQKLGIPILA